MTADEKEHVFEDWMRFLGPLALEAPVDKIWKAFTATLYNHLIQHCSFIAHYDRQGFYQVYFAQPTPTVRFLRQFDRDTGNLSCEYGGTWWLSGDYADINRAMCDEFEGVKQPIYAALKRRIKVETESEIEQLHKKLEDLA